MHPILGNWRRLVLYLSAWAPITAILAYLFVSLAGLTGARAAALAIPLCLVYAFACLSAWYSSRWIPLKISAAGAHLAAAVVAALLWIATARGLADLLSASGQFPALNDELGGVYRILFGTGVLLYLLAAAFYYALLSSEAAHAAERGAVEARALARESELKALKTQLDPHFIFNCLNSISALTSTDPRRAREMCVCLGEFLRKTLCLGEKPEIPLGEELELVRAYLAVEQIRFGGRLKLDETAASGALGCMVPPLLLQPLVENAIRHGIATLAEGGWIRLAIEKGSPDELSIRIENNFDPLAPKRRGANIGLKNVRERLDATYGSSARFDVRAHADRFQVSLDLPAETPR